MLFKLSKKITAFGVASAVVLSLSAAAPSAFAAEAKYSDHDPLGGMRPQFLHDVWFPEIEKQTNGALKIRSFFGGALLKNKEALKGVSDNVAQISFTFPGNYPSRLLVHNIFALFPQGPEKFVNQAWLWRAAYEQIPAFKAELDKANVIPLLVTAGLPGAFAGKKPLANLSAIKGDNWRAGGKWYLRYLGGAGALPVSVPWGDIYVALQTGAIDGVFTNYDGLHLMKFDEVAPNMLISKKLWYALPFLHYINKDYFESLPKEVQEGVLKASKIAEQKFAKVYDDSFEKVKSEQLAAGVKITVMTDADLDMWADPARLAVHQANWVKDAEAAGLKDAAGVMEKVRALHKQAMNR
jgi:TRAP-type C4-dicarboxylate transport system substrate-binding protein